MSPSIADVVAWIARRDPPFPARIRSAQTEEIAQLEAVVGQPLPAEYCAFLALMGHGTDWLELADADLDIASITAYYRARGQNVPAGHIFIGKARSDPAYDMYLHLAAPGITRVVSFATFAATQVLPRAGSLAQWVGTAALLALRFPELPVTQRISGANWRAQLLMVGDRALGEQGLHPMDFSNDWVRAYDGDGVAGIGYQFPGSGCHFDLCALSQDVLRPFTRALGRAFGG